MTNFEKIQKMSMDELAEELDVSGCRTCVYNDKDDSCDLECQKGIRLWLESEAEDDNEH